MQILFETLKILFVFGLIYHLIITFCNYLVFYHVLFLKLHYKIYYEYIIV